MPDSIDFSWDRGKSPADLAKDFDRLETALDKHLESAMETWVLMVEGTAKQLCAVLTGRLRASISSEVRRVGRNVLKGFIGTNVEYGPFVERGTRYQEAQPFLAPAVEAHLDDAERLFSGGVDAAIAEVS